MYRLRDPRFFINESDSVKPDSFLEAFVITMVVTVCLIAYGVITSTPVGLELIINLSIGFAVLLHHDAEDQ